MSHSTTVCSSLASIRPRSRRPVTRSIINCESLPKGGLGEVLEAIGRDVGDQRREERTSDDEDSLIQELVDILEVKKSDESFLPLRSKKAAPKAKSAMQSPRQTEGRISLKPQGNGENGVVARVEMMGKRAIVIRKSKSIKLVMKGRLPHSTGVSPLLNARHTDKPPKRFLDLSPTVPLKPV